MAAANYSDSFEHFFLNHFLLTSADLTEKISFNIEYYLGFIWIDSQIEEGGDIQLTRKGATGRFKTH